MMIKVAINPEAPGYGSNKFDSLPSYINITKRGETKKSENIL